MSPAGSVASVLSPAPERVRPARPLAERLGEAEFARFHAAVAPRLWGYLRSHLHDASTADDLAQEAFTRVLASNFEPESEEHLVRYLYRTATNLLHDRARGRRRAAELVPLDEQHDRPQAPASGAALDVTRALTSLRPRDRRLLWLAHVEGLEHKVIAEMIGASPGSVRVLLHRARRRLADRLGRGPIRKGAPA